MRGSDTNVAPVVAAAVVLIKNLLFTVKSYFDSSAKKFDLAGMVRLSTSSAVRPVYQCELLRSSGKNIK
jgi:hypothetical protein